MPNCCSVTASQLFVTALRIQILIPAVIPHRARMVRPVAILDPVRTSASAQTAMRECSVNITGLTSVTPTPAWMEEAALWVWFTESLASCPGLLTTTTTSASTHCPINNSDSNPTLVCLPLPCSCTMQDLLGDYNCSCPDGLSGSRCEEGSNRDEGQEHHDKTHVNQSTAIP